MRGASAPTDPPVDPAKSRVEVPQAGCPATPSRRPLPYIKAPGRRFTTVVVNTPEQRLGRSFHCYEVCDARIAAELIADAYERGKQDGLERSDARIRALRRKLKRSKQGKLFAAKCGELAGVLDCFAQELNHFDSDDVKGMLAAIKRLRDDNAIYVRSLAALTDLFDALSCDGAEAGVQVALEHALEHLNAGRDKHARDLIHQTLNALRRKPEVAHG